MLNYNELAYRNIENSVMKASVVKPLFRVLGFGEFNVLGREGDRYKVTFHRNIEGELAFECECAGHVKGNYACYHSMAVVQVYLGQEVEALKAAASVVELGGMSLDSFYMSLGLRAKKDYQAGLITREAYLSKLSLLLDQYHSLKGTDR